MLFRSVEARYSDYRRLRAETRGRQAIIDKNRDTVDSYMDRVDWRVNENANMDYSYAGLRMHLMGDQEACYTLNEMPKEMKESHEQGFFHIHDLSQGLTGYCAGWSLRDLLMEGFNCPGKDAASGPAKRFDTALGQMNNFLGTLQNEWAGAQAFNNVDTYLAPLAKADRDRFEKKYGPITDDDFYKDIVKQGMQKFIHNINTTSRWGGQTPFTNLSFDLTCPEHIRDEPVIIGGKLHESLIYGDFDKEMKMINKAFLEVMIQGDHHERMFPFPIPTYNVVEDFPWDSEVGDLIAKLTAKFGVPYFQNFISSGLNPEDVRSMCCRLQMDLREIQNVTGGLFGAGDLTGSIGVITLNLSKLAFLAESEMDFLDKVEEYAELAKESLELKRKMLDRNLSMGLYPWTKRYLKNGYKAHFSTIGLNGGHEACLNLLGKGIETSDGIILMQNVLGRLRLKMTQFQEETGHLYNLEATPAEGTGYRLAKIDQKMHPGIIQSGNGTPYNTNSTALPVGMTEDVLEALEHQNQLQPMYSGGTVFHTMLGEAVTDTEALKRFIKKAFTLTKIPYLSITPTYSNCGEHGHIDGEHFECPTCGEDTEVFTRIVGYYRPVSRWNKGKQAEYTDRVEFTNVASLKAVS